MFAAIAGRYDLNNRIHSFGRDQAWRRAAVRAAGAGPTDDVLDAACGTGDLSEAFLRAGVRSVTGLDFTAEMLDIAREKAPSGAAPLTYVLGDATDLPFEAGSFDIVSIAFGIRNVGEPRRALAEFHRVLRPGGRLIVLEFTTPSNPLIRLGNAIYCRHIMPLTATLIARDRSGAYRYLPRSIDTFQDPATVMHELRGVGFDNVSRTALTFGVCSIYRAERGPDGQ